MARRLHVPVRAVRFRVSAAVLAIGLVLVLVVTPGLAVADPATSPAGPRERRGPAALVGADSPPSISLRFNGLSFDPVIGTPLFTPELRSGPGEELFLVQFTGPILPAWTDSLRTAPAETVWYLPDYAFLVRADPAMADDLRQLPGVRWVGAYHPGYRIGTGLTDQAALLPADAVLPVAVQSYDPAGDGAATEALLAAGGAVRRSDPLYAEGWIRVDRIDDLARLPGVLWIDTAAPLELENGDVARVIHVRQELDGAFADDGRSLWSWYPNITNTSGIAEGAGTIIAVHDTGLWGGHEMFPAWKQVAYFGYGSGTWNDCNGHGTHVAGTAAGWKPAYMGMAPQARLIGGDIGFCGPGASVGTLLGDAKRSGANISTNSWAQISTQGAYTWISQSYDDYSRDADRTAAGNQPMVVLFAAGNSGSGATTVWPPGTSKNVITVGAATPSGTGINGFSSRGPMLDGRMKPDILTPGSDVTSASVGCSTCYATWAGTSMATPGAAGAAAVVISHLSNRTGHEPSPALVKGLLINGADILPTYTYPGNGQGWGLANVSRSLLESPERKVWFHDGDADRSIRPEGGVDDGAVRFDAARTGRGLLTNESVTWRFEVADRSEFRVTLVWSDEPGASNNPIPALVNDLHLRLTAPNGTEYYGNVFAAAESVTGGANDTLNNVEGFRQVAPAAGAWTVTVLGGNVPAGPQRFSLIVSGDLQRRELRVSDLRPDTAVPYTGATVRFDAMVENSGDSDAPDVPWQLVRAGDDGAPVVLDQGVLALVPASGNASLAAVWTATPGTGQEILLRVDPGDVVVEARKDDNVAGVLLTVQDLTFTVRVEGGAEQLATPGGSVIHRLVIENRGTLRDGYTLGLAPARQDGSGDWAAALSHGSVATPPGGSTGARLTVVTPAHARPGDRLVVSVTVRSEGSGATVTVDVTTTVRRSTGVTVATATGLFATPPGVSVLLTLDVATSANAPTEAALRVGGLPDGWTAALSSDRIVLDAWGSGTVFLEIAPPAGAPAGERALVTVSAGDTADPGGPESELTVAVQVLPAPDLDIRIAGVRTRVVPGGEAIVVATVANHGNTVETLVVTGAPPGGWPPADAVPGSVTVDPGGSSVVEVTVQVPAGTSAGAYPARVAVVRADRMAEVLASLAFDVEVLPLPGVALGLAPHYLTIAPSGPGATGIVVLTVTNSGNTPDRFLVTAVPMGAGISAVRPPGEVTLAPGETAVLPLVVESDGSAGRAVIRVVAASAFPDGPAVEGRVTVTVAAPDGPGPRPARTPGINPFAAEFRITVVESRPAQILVAAILGVVLLASIALLMPDRSEAVLRALRERRSRRSPDLVVATPAPVDPSVPVAAPPQAIEPHLADAPAAPSGTEAGPATAPGNGSPPPLAP